MKATFLNLCAATCIAMFGGVSCAAVAACVNYDTNEKAKTETTVIENENNRPVDGMFFDIEHVVEEYEADGGLWIVYTDIDAGLDECPIRVDAYTYGEILHAINNGLELIGALYETKEKGVFTYAEEPEFEMAAASAKGK